MQFSHEYFEINDALQRVDADMDAAECHGQLVGMLSATITADKTEWLAWALRNAEKGNALVAESDQILTQLFDDTCRMLQAEGMNMEFELLLPDDETAMTERLLGLGHWCQGFLFGIASAGIKKTEALPGDIPEFIRDVTEISRADRFTTDQEEEDENAYAEIVEYVRVGVMLMRTEMHHLYQQAENNSRH